jgi:hypothetical protein
MAVTLQEFIEDFAEGLLQIDRSGVAHKHFQPGIGPYGEADAVKGALIVMKTKRPDIYRNALTKRHPDLLIPHQWQIELKVIRPFGDNGKEAENWSQNLLHPYSGNTSTIGDCIELLAASGDERKAVVVFGYEHDPAQVSLEPCIQGFELLASTLQRIRLSKRTQVSRRGLSHPVHQVLHVFGWEVIGRLDSQ